MIARIPLFAVEQAAKIAQAKAKALRTLQTCLRQIDQDDPLVDTVIALYHDAQTYGAYGVFFKADAIGDRS